MRSIEEYDTTFSLDDNGEKVKLNGTSKVDTTADSGSYSREVTVTVNYD